MSLYIFGLNIRFKTPDIKEYMFRFLLFLFLNLTHLTQSNSTELGKSYNSGTPSNQIETSRKRQKSRPIGRNSYSCSPKEIADRNALHYQCRNNFSQFGIQTPIDADEIIEPESCDKAEPKEEYYSGCGTAFSDIPKEALQGVLNILGVKNFNRDILAKCSTPPKLSNGRLRRITRGQGSPKEKAIYENYKKMRSAWDSCAIQVKNNTMSLTKSHEMKMNDLRVQCNSYFNGSRSMQSTKKNRLMKNCMLRLAGEYGCSSCIYELAYIPPNLSLLDKLLPEIKKFKESQCFNKRALGKFSCQIGLKFAGTLTAGYSGYRLVRLLGDSAIKQTNLVAQSVVQSSQKSIEAEFKEQATKTLGGASLTKAVIIDLQRVSDATMEIQESLYKDLTPITDPENDEFVKVLTEDENKNL